MTAKLVSLQAVVRRAAEHATPDCSAFEIVRRKLAEGEIRSSCQVLRTYSLLCKTSYLAELEQSAVTYFANSQSPSSLDAIRSEWLLSLFDNQRIAVWENGRVFTLFRHGDHFDIWFQSVEKSSLANIEILQSFWRNAVLSKRDNHVISDDFTTSIRCYASDVWLSSIDVHDFWPAIDDEPPKKRGRPRKIPHAAVRAEAEKWLLLNRHLKPSLAAVTRHILDIAPSRWGQEPGFSTVQAIVRPIWHKHRAKDTGASL